jgi:four helix bundle protein
MSVESYRDLHVWQKAMDFVVDCYQVCNRFPKSETYGLSSQLQRSAVSIPANIAEGAGRGHTKEYVQHLCISNGSLFESETHLMIAVRLGYLAEQDAQGLLARSGEIGRMLRGLMAALERKMTSLT